MIRSRAADKVPGTPSGWRPSHRSRQLRRSAAAVQLDGARDQRDRVAQLLRTEGGIKRGDELAGRPPAHGRVANRRLRLDQRAGHGRVTRRPQGPGRQAGRHALQHFRAHSSEFGQRGVELIAAPARRVEEIRGTVENRGRGLLDPQRGAVDAVAVKPRLNDNAVQPDQLVYQAHGRPSGSAQPGWAVGRRQEGTAQGPDGLVRPRSRMIAIQRKLFVHAAEQVREPRTQPGGQRPAGGGRGTTQPVARWRGPQERRGNQRDASGHPPAGQPVGYGRRRSGQRHRQDEGQQQRRGRPGQHRADHASKDHAEPRHRHRNGREPRGLRGQRGQADEHPAGHGERCLGLEPFRHGAAEVDQEQHRERPERRERSHLRVADDLVAQGEHGRHDDRCPGGTAQRGEAAVTLAQPPQGVHVDFGRAGGRVGHGGHGALLLPGRALTGPR